MSIFFNIFFIGDFSFSQRIRDAMKEHDEIFVLDLNLPKEVQDTDKKITFIDHHIQAKIDNPLVEQINPLVEEKDASEAQKTIQEINSGIYCFDKQFLLVCLNSVKNDNAQREYYLPDTIALARKNKRKVSVVLCADPDEVMGVNTRYDLNKAEKTMQSRINRHWMKQKRVSPQGTGYYTLNLPGIITQLSVQGW